MGRAVIDDALQLACMIVGILRCAPDTHDTKLTAATFSIVVGSIKSTPRMPRRLLHCPTLGFGVLERLVHFLLWMRVPSHVEIPCANDRVLCVGCQLTTIV